MYMYNKSRLTVYMYNQSRLTVYMYNQSRLTVFKYRGSGGKVGSVSKSGLDGVSYG